MKKLFSFPDPVNETSARVVAAGVVAMAVTFLVVREGWVLVPLVYGFAARVLTGPTLSPLGQLATRGITPWLAGRMAGQHRLLPGPPKRFAQGIGLVFSAGAAVAWVSGAPLFSYVLIAGLTIAASLEAVFALCLGCVVHQRVFGCDECSDISDRFAARATN
ncbi:DUF4395 domain-containing protein [soil metagenome]